VSQEEPSAPRTPADLAGQLRAAADQIMASWTKAAGSAVGRTVPVPGLPTMPATMSVRQMEALLEDLAARRAQVQALKTQLEAFDDQLGSLEANLRPLLEWTRTWANVEGSIADFWRPLSGGGTG
jgi:outer membrane protein TolC